MKIVITVPHSKCNGGGWILFDPHDCDKKSASFARKLNKAFKRESKLNTILILGDVNRIECDLNRKSCHDSKKYEFSKKLDKFLKEDNTNLLLDIHSFPGNHITYELYILVLSGDKKSMNISKSLYVFLKKNGVDIAATEGDKTNHILYLGYEYSIPSVLVEINERLSDTRMRELSNLIKKWVLKSD